MREALEQGKLRSVYDHTARRYDAQHAFFTGRSDQLGRELLVEHAVSAGDRILDCGAGTGATSLLAARKVGPGGKVVMLDMSEGMLEVARTKAEQSGLQDRLEIRVGDILHLPFGEGSFDTVLSTYSLCPVYDPAQGAKELYRVTRPGGLIGIAHSTEPDTPWVRWMADKVENIVWMMPYLSLGCRAVSVLPTFEQLGCKTNFKKKIGIPLWPFIVFVVEKPSA